jgi:hypothetical protein
LDATTELTSVLFTYSRSPFVELHV